MNGFDAADPYVPARAIFFPDLHAADSVRLAGGRASYSTRSGAASWHGSVSSYFTSSAFASGSLPQRARDAGLLRNERFRWYTSNNLQFGGPVASWAEIFISATGRWTSQWTDRDPLYDRLNARVLVGAASAQFHLTRRDSVNATFTGSRIDLSGFGFPAGFEALLRRRISPPFEPLGNLRQEDLLDSVQVSWARSSDWQIRYGYGIAHLDTALPSPDGSRPYIELLDGSVKGPPPLANLGVRKRQQLAVTRRMTGSNYQVAFGGGWQLANVRNRFLSSSDRQLIVADGRPASMIVVNTPLDSRARITEAGLHASGSVSPARWFSFAAGVRPEHLRGSVVDSSTTAITWTNISWRFAISLQPALPGQPRFAGSYRRFYHPLAGQYLDYANPNSLSGREYQWIDQNGDGLWQPGESDRLLRRFGGEHSVVDPALRRPFSDEFAVSLQSNLPLSISGSIRLFRRDAKEIIAAPNRGVPFSSYRRVSHADSGADFQPGTFDDQLLSVYEQDPKTFGADRFFLTNTDLDFFSSGLVAQLTSSHRRYWWRLSFTAEKGYGTTSPGNAAWENDPGIVGSLLHDPNSLINATGRIFMDRAYLAKLQGAARIRAFELGVVTAYWDGLPFARRLLIEGLAQGPFVIQATPRGSPEGGHRTEFNLTVDVRLSRRFQLRHGSLRAVLDILNLPNLRNNTRERDLSSPDFNRRLPVSIQPPRYLRLGLEYDF
jgi:hypothetical protein